MTDELPESEQSFEELATVDSWSGEDICGSAVTDSGRQVWLYYGFLTEFPPSYDLPLGTRVRLRYVKRWQDGFDFAADRIEVLPAGQGKDSG